MRSSPRRSVSLVLLGLAAGCSGGTDAHVDAGTDGGPCLYAEDAGHEIVPETCNCTAASCQCPAEQWCAPAGVVTGFSGGDRVAFGAWSVCVGNAITTQREGEPCSLAAGLFSVHARVLGACSGPTQGEVTFRVFDCAPGLLCNGVMPGITWSGVCRAACDPFRPAAACGPGLECTFDPFWAPRYACTPPTPDAGELDGGLDAGTSDAGELDASTSDAG